MRNKNGSASSGVHNYMLCVVIQQRHLPPLLEPDFSIGVRRARARNDTHDASIPKQG